MTILNENEAIVINSLENWGKVAEILDKAGIVWNNKTRLNEYLPNRTEYISVFLEGSKLKWCHGVELNNMQMIQDTEFIAKHSKNIFQEQMEAFYSQPLKQDKNMKIVVKKENFLIGLGEYRLEEYKEGFKIHPSWSEKVYKLENGDCANVMFESQYKELVRKGYIEEVKEVSYRFEDISGFVVTTEPICSAKIHTSNQKQAKQLIAFAKLTHVRAKILKDYPEYGENWEPSKIEKYECVVKNSEGELKISEDLVGGYDFGITLKFPRGLAKFALQHNQELFKTYLGV